MNDGLGAAHCALCDPGTFASSTTTCSLVPPGQYASGYGTTYPAPNCGPGTFQALPGQTGCSPCPAGRYQPSGMQPSPACLDCGRGYFSGVGSANCTACPSGTYNNETSGSACQLCAEGTTTDGEGGAVRCVAW
jgi:hypothetical protein